MTMKQGFFAACIVLLILVVNSAFSAVDEAEINKVRNKSVLDSADKQIIDNFVAEAVDELLKIKDFSNVARARTIILSRKNSSIPNGQSQYSQQFSKSASKYIQQGFEEAESLEPQSRKFRAILNLLILIDGLEDLRLVNLATDKFNHNNKVVRYWAVHAVTNSGIVGQLNSGQTDEAQIASDIVSKLGSIAQNVGPETLGLMATFAAKLNKGGAEKLLLNIVDMRIAGYSNWTIQNELMDANILKLLYEKISSGQSSRKTVAHRFGQLYSYAMQRYISGQDFLSDQQRSELASVLAEIEKSCFVYKPLSMPQQTIRAAIGKGNMSALLAEHSRLFGEQNKAGELTLKLNCDFGKNPDGSTRISPAVLPQPPQILRQI